MSQSKSPITQQVDLDFTRQKCGFDPRTLKILLTVTGCTRCVAYDGEHGTAIAHGEPPEIAAELRRAGYVILLCA